MKNVKEKKVDLSIIKKMCALCSTTSEYLQYAEDHLINGFENNFYQTTNYSLKDRNQRRKLDKELEVKSKQIIKQSQEQIKRLNSLEEHFKEAMKDTEGELIESYIASIHSSLEGLETRSELCKVYERFTLEHDKLKNPNKLALNILNSIKKILD